METWKGEREEVEECWKYEEGTERLIHHHRPISPLPFVLSTPFNGAVPPADPETVCRNIPKRERESEAVEDLSHVAGIFFHSITPPLSIIM